MPLTTIRSTPALDSFTPLAEHQSQTPPTFYGAKPVLHSHITGARALIQKDQIPKLPLFADAIEAAAQAGTKEGDQQDGIEEGRSSPVVAIVDILVTSENLILFNPSTSSGLSIPYPTISLHAISRVPNPLNPSEEIQGLYMQLELESDEGSTLEDDEEVDIVDVTLIPPAAAASSSPAESVVKALFDAVSACSNLHPDPASQEDQDMLDGDEDGGHAGRIVFEGNVGYEGISGLPGALMGTADGGLPPPFPGSGGWITAENVGEFFDGEGNWIGGEEGDGEPLGEGAGRVRGRDEVDGGDVGEGAGVRVNGYGADDEEHKRPRTE